MDFCLMLRLSDHTNGESSRMIANLATRFNSRHSSFTMNVAIEIPDDVSASLQFKWRDVPRRALEAVAAEAYRSGALTSEQVGRLLGHSSRWESQR